MRDRALADFQAGVDALRAAEESCGLAAAEYKARELGDRETLALDALLAAVPHSLDDVALVAGYLLDSRAAGHIHIDEDCMGAWLRTLAARQA